MYHNLRTSAKLLAYPIPDFWIKVPLSPLLRLKTIPSISLLCQSETSYLHVLPYFARLMPYFAFTSSVIQRQQKNADLHVGLLNLNPECSRLGHVMML